ncbi:MAG: hypothetical protein IAE80_21120 [Anaerolinea sp.]|nr:hypothetical protein [Anaerolinea sp.]
MTVVLHLPIKLTLPETLRLIPRDEDINPLCLALATLRFDLVDSLSLSAQPHLVICRLSPQQAKRLPANHGGYMIKLTEGYELHLKESEVENWLRFYLAYHRDGIGSVDHIDLQYPLGQDRLADPRMTVILQVPKAQISSPRPME